MNIISDSTLDVKVLQETKSRYKLYSALSPLKELFKQNAEMAAHTSNETWARDIHEFLKIAFLDRQGQPSLSWIRVIEISMVLLLR